MKIIKLLSLSAMAFFMLQSCISTKNVPSNRLSDKWELISMDGKSAATSFPLRTPYMTLDFAKGEIAGNGGCNGFGGKFTYENGEFKASNLISTMMYCDGVEESAFFKFLENKSRLSLVNDNLQLIQDGKTVLTFARAKPLAQADLSGVWTLQSLNGRSVDSDIKNPTFELNFAENRISGNNSCNTYTGTFTLSNNVLTVNPTAVTAMACINKTIESEFKTAFTGAFDLEKISANTLALKRDGVTVMLFTK